MTFVKRLRLAVVAVGMAAALVGSALALPSSASTSAPAGKTKAGATGPITAAACTQPGGSRPTLRLNSSGPWVSYLQCLINENVGYDFFINPDGGFGFRTQAGVLWLQVCEEIALGSFAVDGVVGSNTWAKAANPDSFCHL